jgi:hypothetical protein
MIKLLRFLPYDAYVGSIKELCRMFPNKVEAKNYYMDYYIVEVEYSIFGLPAGYWAYGYFQPDTPMFYLDREEKLDRVGVVI